MTEHVHAPCVADELRERAGSFVNAHVGLWVAVEDDGVLVLAADNAADIFQAAADWLTEGDAYTVTGLAWQHQTDEPHYTARLTLRHPGQTDTPTAPTQAIP
ncbi:hypothetical protein [Streptomyces sp. NPDC021020]|uniref:hypothetical protein n=1 Tax=Streptomyces sp. NPDC021020 TaxID=3365109 RepID=UPI0037A3D40E